MSQQIQITGGAKVRNLEGVLTGTAGVVNALGINVPSGIPQLDGSGKILVSQLPNSVMEYKGTWNAATNTPTLANGTGNQGDVYLCSTAGTVNFGAGAITFAVGDQVIYSGTIWQKAGGATGTVTSVAVTESGDALTITGSPITTSGTINIGFAGTTGQYVNGAGGLTTFPTLTGFVPYTGATSNVALGEFGLSAGYIGLDTTPTSTPTSVGTLSWDTTYKTPKVITGTGNTTLQIGQEEVILIHNGTGSALTDGQVVYVTGSTGDLPSVSLADASSETTSAATLGVVTEPIANGSNGFVTVSGMVNGLNTLAYNEGDLLWLSETAGAFTNVKPISPAHLVLIGYVIKKAGGNGSILVKIQNTQELEECSDVLFTSLANNNILAYESSTDLWKNKTIAAVLGYTPQAQLNGTGFIKASGTTISYDNSTYLTTSSAASTYVPYTGATNNVNLGENDLFVRSISNKQLIKIEGYVSGASTLAGALAIKTSSSGSTYGGTGYISVTSNDTNALTVVNESGLWSKISFNSISANRTFTFPNASGTIALTSDIPSLSGYIQGSGTTNYIPKFTASGTIGDSAIVDNASYVDVRKSFQVSSLAGTGALMTITSNAADTVEFRAINSSGGNKELFYFGSTVSFYTGALDVNSTTERMTITPTGNVGIGVTSPTAAKFQLSGSNSLPLAYLYNNSGSAGNVPGVYIEAGTNASDYALSVNSSLGASRLYVRGDGNVGIGTSSPTTYSLAGKHMEVFGGGDYSFIHNNTNTVKSFYAINEAGLTAALYTFSNHPLLFGTNNTERMRITSSGNVGIGTSSPSYKLSIVGPNGQNSISWTDNVNNTGYLGIRGTAAAIAADNNLVFETAGVEKMRVTTNGNVLVNRSADVPSIYKFVTKVGTDRNIAFGIQGGDCSIESFNDAVNTGTPLRIYAYPLYFPTTAGDTTGSGANMVIDGTSGRIYRSTSSLKYKKNVENYTKGLADVMQMRPVTYKTKTEGDNNKIFAGFIAEEIHDLGLNEFVQYAEDGSPDALAYGNMVSLLVKAVQELKAEIDELKNK